MLSRSKQESTRHHGLFVLCLQGENCPTCGNDDQKFFGGTDLQEVTQRVETGQEMRIEVKGGALQRWTEV